MKLITTLAAVCLSASALAQVQLGKNVQIGAGSTAGGFITSLTTTGTSGAASVASGVLNIPVYSFNFTLGSTPIASGSTTTAVTGLSVNGVTLNAAGNSSLFLNQAGGYTAPAGGFITSLTTTGTSGPSTVTSGVLNVPQYSGGSSVGTTGQLQMVGSSAGSFAASSATDSGTTLTVSKPLVVNDGTGKAGAIQLQAGTAPSAALTSTIQINAPTTVTAYAINLPGTQPTAGNTRLDCTAANPAVCTWAAAAASTGFPITLGSTSVPASSTTTTIAGLTLTSPTLTTPALGVATATSVNGTTIPTSATLTQTIASGTSALGTSAIASGACATVVTTTATGVASTDAISWNPNGSVKAVTGYVPSINGGLTIAGFPTANAVNWDVCNWTAASITPGAVTLNWRVAR